MQTTTIKKTIDIDAAKEKVWEVLIRDEYTRQWYEPFFPGSYALSDWQEGSKIIFRDTEGNGMVGRIQTKKPHELLEIEMTGMLDKGREDYDSPLAQEAKGGKEIYTLTENAGRIRLDIAGDTSEDMAEMMSGAWDRSLQIIKELAEGL